MKTTREEFLAAISRYPTIAEAARALGVTPQSAEARLRRIRERPSGEHGAITGARLRKLSNAALEQSWNDCLDAGDTRGADDAFGEMCERLGRESRI